MKLRGLLFISLLLLINQSGIAAITSPAAGELRGESVVIEWSDPASVHWVRAYDDNERYIDSGITREKSWMISLPADGSNIRVVIYSWLNGQWLSTSRQFVSLAGQPEFSEVISTCKISQDSDLKPAAFQANPQSSIVHLSCRATCPTGSLAVLRDAWGEITVNPFTPSTETDININSLFASRNPEPHIVVATEIDGPVDLTIFEPSVEVDGHVPFYTINMRAHCVR